MTTIIFNLTAGEGLDIPSITQDENFILSAPFEVDQFSLSTFMLKIKLELMLNDIAKAPGFKITNDVIIVARLSIQSLAMILGIKSAFPSCKVWFLTETNGVFIDMHDFESVGLDFQMKLFQQSREEILSSEGLIGLGIVQIKSDNKEK